RDEFPLLEARIPDPGDAHRLRRPTLRHVEDESQDHRRGVLVGMEAPLHVPVGQGTDAAGRPAALRLPDVSVVVVSFETRDLLRRLLESLREVGGTRSSEVLVVDNASGDGTVGMLREEFPEVRVIANAENVGYSRAVNQAIRAASGRYLLLL